MASRLVDDVAMEKIVAAQNPWLVLLAIRAEDTMGTCSGTFVTRIHVLTNAQCLIRQRTGPRSVTVFYSSYEKFRGYRIRGSHYLVHPSFSEATLTHDVALVKLENPFIESKYARTICIPVERFDTEGVLLIVAGWGQEDNSEKHNTPVFLSLALSKSYHF
ncbi:hypothetical protein MRX96_008710 [Rhipicephalus microplus]